MKKPQGNKTISEVNIKNKGIFDENSHYLKNRLNQEPASTVHNEMKEIKLIKQIEKASLYLNMN